MSEPAGPGNAMGLISRSKSRYGLSSNFWSSNVSPLVEFIPTEERRTLWLVNERIKAFRSLPQYKGWRLVTSFEKITELDCLMVAKVYDDMGELVATGHAHETKASSFINKTSYIENCETSAVGRALGLLGIGIAFALAYGFNKVPIYAGMLEARWDVEIFVRAISIALFLGLLGGLYPAFRATRLQPVEALRYE